MPRRHIPDREPAAIPPKTIVADAETDKAAARLVLTYKRDKGKGGGLSAGFDIAGFAVVEKPKRKGRGSNARID